MTMISRRAFAHAAGGTVAALLLGTAAFAQANGFPDKPIRVIVPFAAGNVLDNALRQVGEEFKKDTGQPLIIESKPGGGGIIAAQAVANAAPDGYTLLVGANNELAIAKLVTRNVKYSPADFTPIGLIAAQPMVLVASTGTGVKNAADFIQLVSKNPGKYSYGSSGVGTSLHLAGEMLKSQGKLFMTHIPYRGVAPLTNDLVGNNLEFGVFVLSSGLPHIKSGKVIALGTTEAKRSPITPDIPALAESPQFKNVDIGVWFALMAPANLPKPVHDKLRKALTDALQSPEFRKKLEATGSVVASPTVDTDKYIASEIDKYRKIVQFAKIEE